MCWAGRVKVRLLCSLKLPDDQKTVRNDHISNLSRRQLRLTRHRWATRILLPFCCLFGCAQRGWPLRSASSYLLFTCISNKPSESAVTWPNVCILQRHRTCISSSPGAFRVQVSSDVVPSKTLTLAQTKIIPPPPQYDSMNRAELSDCNGWFADWAYL
jgi:hypothetical protein